MNYSPRFETQSLPEITQIDKEFCQIDEFFKNQQENLEYQRKRSVNIVCLCSKCRRIWSQF